MPVLLLDGVEPCAAEVEGGRFTLPVGKCPAIAACPDNAEVFIRVWGFCGEDTGVVPVPSACVIGTDGTGVVEARGCIALDWGGGLVQVLLAPKKIAAYPDCEPEKLGRARVNYRGASVYAELYRDNGARLALLDQKGDLIDYFAIGHERYGSVSQFEAGKRHWLNVMLGQRAGEYKRLLLLDENMEPALDISGDAVRVEAGRPQCVTDLCTFAGHERLKEYSFADGKRAAEKTAIGFYTRERKAPLTARERALCLVQAAGLGLLGEAREYLEPALSKALEDSALAEFFGGFGCAILKPEFSASASFRFAESFRAFSNAPPARPDPGAEDDASVTVGVLCEAEAERLFGFIKNGSGGGVLCPRRVRVEMRSGLAEDLIETDE